jgi:hypothetical protein
VTRRATHALKGPPDIRDSGEEDEMAYRPVTRVVTVEFVKEVRGRGYEVRITPERVLLRCHDKITWDVQGMPLALAMELEFGNFRPVSLYGRAIRVMTGVRKGLVPPPACDFKPPKARVGRNFRATIDSDRAEPGLYKYNIYYKNRVLLDPEGEIKGPKG